MYNVSTMNQLIKLAGLSFILLGAGCQSTSVSITEAVNFDFEPDTGVRMMYASNPGVRLDADGTMNLLYEDRSARGQKVAEATDSSDWLDFDAGETITDASPYRAIKLPDGTYRSYGYNPTVGQEGGCLESRSSIDGEIFTKDAGCRYELTEDDQNWMGVYDLFIGPSGEVVLFYLGDKWGLNNIRRAVSTDNGWTFTFDQADVLGDAKNGGGMNSYVDERVIELDDGSYYLIAMLKGNIYGFTSDDSVSFSEPTLLLAPSDFTEMDLISLNDPQIIKLSDGRYRIYVTGIEDVKDPDAREKNQHIFSATTSK